MYKSGIKISFQKEWFNKGYSKLSDILDVDGMLYTHEETLLRGLKIFFLEYERLRYDVLKLNLIQMNNDKNGPYLPYIYFKMGHEVRGCARTNILKNTNYNILLNVQEKWEEILEEEIRIETIEKLLKIYIK